jgi:hypothetical protein
MKVEGELSVVSSRLSELTEGGSNCEVSPRPGTPGRGAGGEGLRLTWQSDR